MRKTFKNREFAAQKTGSFFVQDYTSSIDELTGSTISELVSLKGKRSGSQDPDPSMAGKENNYLK